MQASHIKILKQVNIQPLKLIKSTQNPLDQHSAGKYSNLIGSKFYLKIRLTPFPQRLNVLFISSSH